MLSVLFLSCRRLHYLSRTLEAIRHHLTENEPHVNAQYICVDNGSSPADRHQLTLMGFDTLILLRENLGIGSAMNRLVGSVRTPYVLNLQDDWLIENPLRLQFVTECIGILDSDKKIMQVKLDKYHFLNFSDRSIYDGPFQTADCKSAFFIQNPKMLWGGFAFPPSITRADALFDLGPFREDKPFQRGWAESEYSARSSVNYVMAKSPELALFRHIGDESCDGWTKSDPKSPNAQDSTAVANKCSTKYAILMVAHNALDMVRVATLKTLEHINAADAKLIVVDNASNDGTEKWLEMLARKGEIKLIRNDTNIGHGPALEQARAQSDSEMIVALDSDAFPLSDRWLTTLHSYLSGSVKISGIRHHRNYIHPACLMIHRKTLDDMNLSFLNERLQASGFDVAERISERIRRNGFSIHGLTLTSHQKKGSPSEPTYLGSEYEGIVLHQWYTTRAKIEQGEYVDDTRRADIEQCRRETIEKYSSGIKDVNIIVGIRIPDNAPDRLRNLKACLTALNLQSFSRYRYRIIVVEQDTVQRVPHDLLPLIDKYIFAFNPGAYNSGWAFNIGAKIDWQSQALGLVDADVLPDPMWLSQTFEAFGKGFRAISPYDELMFLDAQSTHSILENFKTGQSFGSQNGTINIGAQGAAFFIDRELYINIGGHDERFRGWGREDRAFWRHVERHSPIHRLHYRLLHLDHQRAEIDEKQLKKNSVLFDELAIKTTLQCMPIGDLNLYESER